MNGRDVVEDVVHGAIERVDIGGESLELRKRELRQETLRQPSGAGSEGVVVRLLHLREPSISNHCVLFIKKWGSRG